MTGTIGRSEALQTELSETYRSVVELTNELEQAKERLTEISFHDSLTGLPNRMLFEERVGQALAVAERERRQLPMMLMDLDGFKEINDSLGHDAGDQVLREVARRLSKALRKSDTVARLGGDEFAILLTTGNGVDGAVGAAEKLLEVLAPPIEMTGNNLHVGASIGIAWYPDHGLAYATVLKHADIAMYEAKQRGNAYAAFETHHAGRALSRLVLASELHEAIAGDGLVLHFQPKVNMRSGEVVGLEALVRWRHPERGLLPPRAFVPLAEKTGAAWGLSLAVLDMALEETSLWRAERAAPMAINVSARILRNPHLVDEIAIRLKRAGMAPQNLLLEINEGRAPRDVDGDRKVVQRLADMGVMVAIDDFGFGYSSLANLKELPLHELKIDRSFITNAIQCETDSAIARCIIELGHSLGIRVIAEGVENEETWRLLSNFGCENAQGYWIARPMPAPEMEMWLRTAGRRGVPATGARHRFAARRARLITHTKTRLCTPLPARHTAPRTSHPKERAMTATESVEISAAGHLASESRLVFEPSPRRVHVVLGGETIADSHNMMLLHEKRYLPIYYFPMSDVAMANLKPSEHTSHCPYKGDARYWSVRAGDAVAENAAWNYPRPIDGAPELADYIAFYWDRMDAWFEEDEEIFVHARDPYKRVDVIRSSRHVRVMLAGELVAESRRAHFLFETGLPTRYYLPAEDVRTDLLRPSEKHTRCPYKGQASYFSAAIGDSVIADIVWTYPDPVPECPKIKDYLCFFNERVDAIIVDGEEMPTPTTPWS